MSPLSKFERGSGTEKFVFQSHVACSAFSSGRHGLGGIRVEIVSQTVSQLWPRDLCFLLSSLVTPGRSVTRWGLTSIFMGWHPGPGGYGPKEGDTVRGRGCQLPGASYLVKSFPTVSLFYLVKNLGGREVRILVFRFTDELAPAVRPRPPAQRAGVGIGTKTQPFLWIHGSFSQSWVESPTLPLGHGEGGCYDCEHKRPSASPSAPSTLCSGWKKGCKVKQIVQSVPWAEKCSVQHRKLMPASCFLPPQRWMSWEGE